MNDNAKNNARKSQRATTSSSKNFILKVDVDDDHDHDCSSASKLRAELIDTTVIYFDGSHP
jgi:hypothetical protein